MKNIQECGIPMVFLEKYIPDKEIMFLRILIWPEKDTGQMRTLFLLDTTRIVFEKLLEKLFAVKFWTYNHNFQKQLKTLQNCLFLEFIFSSVLYNFRTDLYA